ncbi:hypothetical protein AAFC00_005422 [Neodothiora populina]|uniref:Glutaredoxin domain-containing protein n=1 Tax=Neodothiora populina TaxID=2781224 RepID=A0ABR3PKV0_9PEZI
MPSQRRLRAFGLLAGVLLLTIIYMSHAGQSTRTSEFYTRTVAAIDAKTRAAHEALDAENHKRIQAAAEAEAAQKANLRDPDLPVANTPKEKPQQKPFAVDIEDATEKAKSVAAKVAGGAKDAVHGVTGVDAAEKSVAGRKMMKGLKDDGVAKVGNSGAKDPASGEKEGEEKEESDEDHETEIELNSILKKSPIIIFSKSYCPYSKKAKHILLDGYNIVPAPYVEELDLHPLGARLQAALEKSTGRRTVPNVLINGKSIGGGDDVANFDAEDKLVDLIKSLGGKRIMEASKLTKKAHHVEA